MVDRYLRPIKTRLFAPIVRHVRVAPDTVTLVALAAGLASAWSAAHQGWHAALALWWLNRTLDGLDGELARAQRRADGTASNPGRGAYLDLMVDLVVYSAIPLGVAWGVYASTGDTAIWRAAAFALAAFYINLGSWALLAPARMATARAKDAPSIAMPAGLIEGTETLVGFSILLLYPWVTPTHAATVLLVFGALTLTGALQRGWWGLRYLQTHDTPKEPRA